jgi:hypothetical protein
MEEEIINRTYFLGKTLETSDYILGIIYKITNKKTGKMYIGQTMSHKMNNGKYRPFEEVGRFKQHISDALKNTKKKQCSYLNNSIRKYGKDAFEVELLEYCLPSEKNNAEIENIERYNTVFPNGYNLTKGGRQCEILPEQKKKLMLKSQEQYYNKKLDKFKGKSIDVNNLDKYIYECNYPRFGGKYFIVKVDDVKSIFVAQHLPLDELREQVYIFLKTAASYAT